MPLGIAFAEMWLSEKFCLSEFLPRRQSRRDWLVWVSRYQASASGYLAMKVHAYGVVGCRRNLPAYRTGHPFYNNTQRK